MTSLDITNGVRTALTRLREAWEWYDAIPPVRKIHRALGQIADGWRRMSHWLNSGMPKGLYARALLIIIAPMVILSPSDRAIPCVLLRMRTCPVMVPDSRRSMLRFASASSPERTISVSPE